MKFFNNKGFTLIELMVSVGIFAVMTALLLFRADRFDGGIVLENMAYDIALSIREAQSYGLNVLETAGGQFTYAYGNQFTAGTQYDFYVDANENRAYDSGGAEGLKRYSLRRGAYISALCAGPDANNCGEISTLNILFLRPNPAALITGDNAYARIVVTGRDGSTRNVVVRKTGQISVE
jgi:prepilin-type N-terminal cleavage/methylation domain-containing protein